MVVESRERGLTPPFSRGSLPAMWEENSPPWLITASGFLEALMVAVRVS